MKESRMTARMMLMRKKVPRTIRMHMYIGLIATMSESIRLYIVVAHLSVVRIWNIVNRDLAALSKVKTPNSMKASSSTLSKSGVSPNSYGLPQ